MWAGVLLALGTSVSWAIGNVFIQKSGRVLGAARAAVWAFLAGGLASAIGAWCLDHRTAPFTVDTAVWTGISGVAGLLAYVCLFVALERARLSIAVPLISSWSLVSGLLSLTVFGERVRPWQLFGAGTVLAGVVMVSVAGSQDDQTTAKGKRGALLAAFGSALGFGVMVPAMAHVAPAAGEFGSSALVYAVGLALGIPLAWRLGVPLAPPPRAAWGLVLMTGAVETLGYILLAFARRFAPVALVSPVASLASALTVLYAWVVLRERIRPLAAVGALLASVGVVLLAT
jgi:drug/metabolite transporter (DMT)-like permease